MTKTNRSISIEADIWIEAKKTGLNLSKFCEEALKKMVEKDEIKDNKTQDIVDLLSGDENLEFLNKMISFISERGYPGVTKKWSDMIKGKFKYYIDPYDLYKLVMDLIEA